MATYAPNFSARYRLRYTCNNAQYSALFRTDGTLFTPDLLVDAVEGFVQALGPLMYSDWQITGAEVSQAGSDFFLPVSLPEPAVGLVDPNTRTAAHRAAYASFTGRTVLANPFRVFVYGLAIDPVSPSNEAQADYRLLISENVTIAAACASLAASASTGLLTGADGRPAVYINPYANVGYSAYRQRKNRRG